MTWFLSFRSAAVGGVALKRPVLLEGDGTSEGPRLKWRDEAALARWAAGQNLLLATHGFKVGFGDGARQLTLIERELALPADAAFIGVLWPGDFAVPVINYPFEANDAVTCGALLADFCNTVLSQAASFSFFSHSLGGRLVLEAVSRLKRKDAGKPAARTVCLTAAAVDRDVLTRQYAAALRNAEHVSVLSSSKDRVLQIAYAGGDFLSDLFGDSDSPFRSALGYKGPSPGAGASVGDYPIPADADCGHSDYMPGGDHDLFLKVSRFTRRCFSRVEQDWPRRRL